MAEVTDMVMAMAWIMAMAVIGADTTMDIGTDIMMGNITTVMMAIPFIMDTVVRLAVPEA